MLFKGESVKLKNDLADANAARINVSTADRTSRLLWHKHL